MPTPAPTFFELYCSRHEISPDRFESVVLARSLYPHARLVAPFILMLWPRHFAADLDLIRGVGQLRRVRDFSLETLDYSHHPGNQGGLRRALKLRVSTKRLRRLVTATLHPSGSARPDPDGTEVPFSAPPGRTGKETPDEHRASS